MKTIWKYELLFAAFFAASTLKATSPSISYTPIHCTQVAPASISATITDADGIEVASGLSPRIYFKKKSENNSLAATNDNLSNGWKYIEASNGASPFNFDIDFTKLTSSVTKDDSIQYFIVAQDLNGEVAWNDVTFTVNPASVDLTSGAFPVSSVTNVFRTIKTYSGTLTVDSTGVANDTNFLSITKAGGLFDALNEGAVSGNVRVVIQHSQFAENGDIALNQWEEYSGCAVKSTPSFTLKITPVSNNIQVRGNSTNAIIRLNGADRVTIDGRYINTSDANGLTIANDLSANSTAVVHFASSSNNGCQKDTIRFSNIVGGAPQNTTAHNTFGIFANGSSIADFNKAQGKNNSYNSFERNYITRVRYGIAVIGNDTTLNKGNAALFNIVGPTSDGIDAIGKIGIAFANQDSAFIIGNKVRHVGGDASNIADTADRAGIYLGKIQTNLWNNSFAGDSSTSIIKNSIVDGNTISYIVNEGGQSAVGIAYLNAFDLSQTSNIISNNMIYSVRANGRGVSGDHAAAIAIIGGHTDIVAHNSINMVDDLDPAGVGAAENPADGIRINSTSASNPIVTELTLMNNSIAMDVNANTVVSHAISTASSDFIWATDALDYNNIYVDINNVNVAAGGVGDVAAFADEATLIDWQRVFTPNQDVNSISVSPEYVSVTDLHIQDISPNIEMGIKIAAITEDVDGDYRLLEKYPSIGADEFGKSYVWYGRESEYTNGVPNWRNYEAPPSYGSDTINVLVDTKNIPWLLTDSFNVAELIVKHASVINLDNNNFHIAEGIRLIGNATVYSGFNVCAQTFGSEDNIGAVHLSGNGSRYVQMDSGSICNLIVTTDTVDVRSHLNIANDFISKGNSSVIQMRWRNMNVKGDVKLYGELSYNKVSNLDSALLNINGTVEQMVEIRSNGSQPGFLSNLQIDKNASGNDGIAHLVTDIDIENFLNLKKGKLVSDGSNVETGLRFKTITMERADSNIVMRTNGSTNDAFFQGLLKRKLDNVAKRYLFPVGIVDELGKHGTADAGYYTPVTVEVSDGTGSGEYITATFYDKDPDSSNVGFLGEGPGDHTSSVEDGASSGNWVDVKGDYVWHVEYSDVNLPYNIQFSAPFMNASNQDELAASPNELRVLKRSTWNSGSWGFQGTHAAATAHSLMPDFTQSNAARRNGLTTFSGFSGGGNSGGGQSLPVKLTELTARAINNNYIAVEWATATEVNNAGFEIQRSANGKDFNAIGFTAGAGNSNELQHYKYDDKNVEAGVRYYYRLEQVDFDGAKETTKIVSAALAEKGNIKWMQLLPNPAEQASSVVVNTSLENDATISITDVKGMLAYQKTTRLYRGINNFDLDLSGYASGIYIVTVNTAAETFSRQLVVK